MNTRGLYFAFIFALVVSSVTAQNTGKQVTHQQLIWYAYFNTLEFNSKWSLASEVHERRFINPDKRHQFVTRSSLHHSLGNNWEASLGFTYFRQSPQDPYALNRIVVPELRPHIQFDFKQPLNRLTLVHRYRAEKRFFRNTSKEELIAGYHSNYRFRYRIGLDYRLLNINKQPLKLKLSNELHINAGQRITYNWFDQNRLYAGISYAVNKNLNVETGYMNWYQQRSSGDQFYDRDIVRFSVHHKIDLKKQVNETAAE